jgi:hypothetical protein
MKTEKEIKARIMEAKEEHDGLPPGHGGRPQRLIEIQALEWVIGKSLGAPHGIAGFYE